MSRAKSARRAKPRPKKARAPAQPVLDEDGNAASRALLGLEDGRSAPEPEGEGSVEDPLQDWPEAEGEPDRWLEERGADDVQKERDG